MGGAWAGLINTVLKLLAVLGLYSKGRADQRRKTQIKGLKAKVKALEEKADVDKMSESDRAVELTGWMRKPDK